MAKNFASLPRDDNRSPIGDANSFQTTDATTPTSLKSPLTVSSAVLTFTIPVNCAQIRFYATTNDCRISEEATASVNYFVLKAGVGSIFVPTAGLDTLYLLRDASSDCTLQFMCSII